MITLADLSSFLSAGAVLSLNHETILFGYGVSHWTSSPGKASFYFPSFFLDEKKPWLEYSHTLECSLEVFERMIQELPCDSFFSRNWLLTSRSKYEKTIAFLHRQFNKGTLQKAVPYVRAFSGEKFRQSELVTTLKSLLAYGRIHPVYVYGFWDAECGMLGATPELLFRMGEDGMVETMACAGTRRRSDDELLITNDPKELYEHQLVVDDISGALSTHGSVEVGRRDVRPFGSLVHLVTPIKVKLSGAATFEQVVKAMHPTAALGAVPREAGKKWLLQYASDVEQRGRYGAPAGVIRGAEGLSVVAIRGMQWDPSGVSLYAGGGVVAASSAEREWEEIQLKLKSIKGILGL